MVDEIRDHFAEAQKADTFLRSLGAQIVAAGLADGPNWGAGDRGKAGVSAGEFADFVERVLADEVTGMEYGWLHVPPAVPVRIEETRDHRAEALRCETACNALATKIVDAEASAGPNWSAGVIDPRFLGRFMEHMDRDKVTEMGYQWLTEWVDSDPDFVPDEPEDL